jgi:hypothetical protein
MAEGKMFPINIRPGIMRDGTNFGSRYYIDGQWTRFQDGVPRKMGGYKVIIDTLPSIPRGLYVAPFGSNFKIFIGLYDSLLTQEIDRDGNAIGGLVDRTPVGFVVDENNLWQFAQMSDTSGGGSSVIAHAAPNLASIGSDVETPIYYGSVDSDDVFVTTGVSVSGGIAVFPPFLMAFGNNGNIKWSAPNNPASFPVANDVFIPSQKIVAGAPARAGTASPGGLFWSLNNLIRATFHPNDDGSPNFRFDIISGQCSILSSSSIVESEGVFFWAGSKNFYCYTGALQELPNQLNLDFFYYNNPITGTGLNNDQSQKVWATKVGQYGEIWWHFAEGEDTECSRAVIFGKRDNTWYDTAISRSCGYFEQTFKDPIWADSEPDGDGNYRLWHHESGVNQDVFGEISAIPAYFETGDISWCAIGPMSEWVGENRQVDLYRVEPDLIQTGNIEMYVKGRAYARSDVDITGPYIITPTTTKVDLRQQRRQMTLRFVSNEIDGFFEMGMTLLTLRTGDTRP